MSTKRQARMNKWVIIVLALVLVVGLGAVTIPNLGSKSKKKSNTLKPSPTISVGLTGSGALLATLLEDARNHTFHAKYKVTGDPQLIGGQLELEWWNKPDHSRVDTISTANGQSDQSASFINGSNGANCQRVNNGDWTCRAIAVPGPGDPNGIITSLTSQLAGRPVSQTNAKIGGRSALCFHVGGGTEPIDVCVNSDGVLLRNASAKVAYDVTSLDTNVPDSVFNTPAKVS